MCGGKPILHKVQDKSTLELLTYVKCSTCGKQSKIIRGHNFYGTAATYNWNTINTRRGSYNGKN
jgi:hypothetical protein